MKICLLNNLYFPYNRGGAEKVAANMAADFKNAGHEVLIISTRPLYSELTSQELPEHIYLPSSFYHLNQHSWLWRLAWHCLDIFSCRPARRLHKIFKKEKPDLIISHNLMGLGLMSVRAIKKSGAKHHHFLHDIQLLHPSGLMIYGQEKILTSIGAKLYQSLTRALIGSPDLVQSPSNWLLQEHLKRGFFAKSNTEIKRLNSLKIKTTNEIVVKNKPAKKLLFVGQIEEHKGILFLIRAFQKLAAPEMTLTIAGTGTKLKAAKELAAEDKRFIFLGLLDKESLVQVMKAADVLIVPSLCYENSPTVIYEAHASGLSVVAANLGGIPEIIDKNDQLFAPDDAADLFKKINSL